MIRPAKLLPFLLTVALSPFVSAQGVPFQLKIQDQFQNVTAVGNGATVTLSANAVSQSIAITLIATNTGASPATVGPPQLSGSPAFSITSPTGPQTVPPNSSISIGILFAPSSGTTTMGPPATAELSVPYSVSGTGGSSGAFGVGLSGTTPNFTVAYDFASNMNVIPLANGSTLPFPATPVGGASPAVITVQNTGNGPGTISSAQVTGAGFALQGLALLPGAVNSGSSLQFTVVYTPQTSGTDTGTLVVTFPDHAVTVNLTGTKTSANFVVAYEFASNQNVIALANGSTLTFPITPVGTTSSAAITVQNSGNSPGTISSVQITGAAFAPQALGLLPATLNAGASLPFTLVYAPQTAGTNTGTLVVTFPDHTVTVNLTGAATLSTFTYQLVESGQTSTIMPGQAISLPPVAVGSTSSFSITVQNTGNGNGVINGASLSGNGFQIINPPTFPQTIAPGGFLTFNYTFTPPQSGTATGVLTIGNASFTFTGSGEGSQLGFSYTLSSITVPVTGGVVTFSPVQVGQSSTASFSIQNTGTSTATIISISTANPKSAFMLTGLPAVPFNLASGASVSFNIVFAPIATGANSDVLQINNQALTLNGSGNPPPALPAYQFTGVSAVEGALQQPSLSLTLAAPYPVVLTGTLSMIEISNILSADPSVQFATGGQTVTFSIPANTTQAIFQNGSNSIRLQTGSVAGTITITPSFTTSGGTNVTPASPATLQFSVPAAAPQLLNIQVSQSTAGGFTLQVIGLDTSRTLSELDFVFTPSPKYQLAASTVSVNVAASAALWFGSAQSQPFGSQFSISIPFGVSSTTAITTSSLVAIESISVTAKNQLGTSNPVVTPPQ